MGLDVVVDVTASHVDDLTVVAPVLEDLVAWKALHRGDRLREAAIVELHALPRAGLAGEVEDDAVALQREVSRAQRRQLCIEPVEKIVA